MKNKKPMFGNFLKDEKAFFAAQSFWRELIRKNLLASNCNSEQIKELDKEIIYDRDANPILYQRFPSLNKSIRIIQEDFDENASIHIGAWTEKPDDFKRYPELVISVELTEETELSANILVEAWFTLSFEEFNKKLDADFHLS